jgi:hypothetical protein
MGYLTDGPVESGLIEIGHLTIVILYAHEFRPGQHALRLAGFGGAAVPWGVCWGGPDQCRFVKDVLLQPVPSGPGLRLDGADTEMLTLALRLDREIDRTIQYRAASVRDRPFMPKLWAGFRPADADSITGDGPENR